MKLTMANSWFIAFVSVGVAITGLSGTFKLAFLFWVGLLTIGVGLVGGATIFLRPKPHSTDPISPMISVKKAGNVRLHDNVANQLFNADEVGDLEATGNRDRKHEP